MLFCDVIVRVSVYLPVAPGLHSQGLRPPPSPPAPPCLDQAAAEHDTRAQQLLFDIERLSLSSVVGVSRPVLSVSLRLTW